MRATNAEVGSVASAESPLPNLRPVFNFEPQDNGPDGTSSRSAGLFVILLALVLLAVVGYVVLSACADGSPLAWLQSKILCSPR